MLEILNSEVKLIPTLTKSNLKALMMFIQESEKFEIKIYLQDMNGNDAIQTLKTRLNMHPI